MELTETDRGFRLTAVDEDNCTASEEIEALKEIPRSEKNDTEQLTKQLSKLGGTIFSASGITISLSKNYFIQVAVLNELRRKTFQNLLQTRASGHKISAVEIKKSELPYPYKKIDFRHNVSNHLAEKFYRRHGVEIIERSFETSANRITGPLMTTKLCLKHENNLCVKQGGKNTKFKEPFYLSDGNIKYRVEFDCNNCMMLIFRD